MSAALLAGIGLKSLATAGVALALLYLLRHRSAAERSLVGHAGLAATLLLPIFVLAVPEVPVRAPEGIAWMDPAAVPQPAEIQASPASVPAAGSDLAVAAPADWIAAETLPLLLYAVPAFLLLLVTLIAVGRLFAIRARAAVLTEPHWLSALAHAQRRMGFKNGAALLTSEELGSPVSWGLFRPTIVLNREAAGSPAEAEAIIAHELAHVVRWDWLKLLAARVAVALFWFNPLVWLLARQCHQLREEAADDAVLASDVAGIDYAQLLVGAARHESRGTLLAANGVAPARDSLKRRVTRVLDAGISRRPGGIGWRAACALLAVAGSAPLAALTPAGPAAEGLARASGSAAAAAAAGAERRVVRALSDEELDLRIDAAADELGARAEAEIDRALETAIAERVAVRAKSEETAVAAPGLTDRIALPRFSGIEARAGVRVTLRPGPGYVVQGRSGGIDPRRFRVEGGRLAIDPCTMDCGAGGNEIVLVLPEIEAVAVQAGGEIVAAPGFPRARSIAAAVRGGGEIDLREVAVEDATAAVNAGGTILVRPARSLTAAIHSGGEIVYWGDPAVTRAVSGGGAIRRGGGT